MWAKMNDQIGFEAWIAEQMKDARQTQAWRDALASGAERLRNASTAKAAAVSGVVSSTSPDRSELVRRLAIEQESSQWIVRQWGAALEAKEIAERHAARLARINARWERSCFFLILACVLIIGWAVSK